MKPSTTPPTDPASWNEVPTRYRGLWRRTLLESDETHDVDTLVFWLQTGHWHADLRIPANRPDFSDIHSLAQCSTRQLQWLLQQEGFIGITEVDGAQCEWHRIVDYRPSGSRDIGRMHFDQDALLESGVTQRYIERWQRVSLANGQFSAASRLNGASRQWLLRAGEFFMFGRPRSIAPARAGYLWARVAAGDASHDEMQHLADFEISFGQCDGHAMRILHSTLPWREGCLLADRNDWTPLSGEKN